MSLLGSSDPDREQLQDQQARQQRHNLNLQNGQPDDRSRDADFVKELTESDASAYLDEHLKMLAGRDLPLANFKEADYNEMKWLVRAYEQLWEVMHPPPQSILQGEYRKFFFDDAREGQSAITAADRLEVAEFAQLVISRATRGRDGWQQEQLDKSIRVSETREESDDDGGWW